MNGNIVAGESVAMGTRLRESPLTRFSGPQHVFDLHQVSEHLLAEAHPGTKGHRQMTIFHRGATTMVLFVFEAGGVLSDHKANGLVTIHVLEGALTVEVQDVAGQGDAGKAGRQTHNLRGQQVLVLNPGVLHNVKAQEASQMLLTVHLEKDAAQLQ